MKKHGFTIVELLVTITIIGVLTGLMIPGIERNLSKNNINNDARLLEAKLQDTKLMAGSTQKKDNAGKTDIGYYALYFPGTLASTNAKANIAADPSIITNASSTTVDMGSSAVPTGSGVFYYVVKLSTNPFGSAGCSISNILGGTNTDCTIETIKFSRGVGYTTATRGGVLVIYRTPSQRSYILTQGSTSSSANTWTLQSDNVVLGLTQGTRTARATINKLTTTLSLIYDTY